MDIYQVAFVALISAIIGLVAGMSMQWRRDRKRIRTLEGMRNDAYDEMIAQEWCCDRVAALRDRLAAALWDARRWKRSWLRAEDDLGAAASQTGWEAYPCPLCEYQNGVLVEMCGLHKQIVDLLARIDSQLIVDEPERIATNERQHNRS